jgi:hypothetical protein
MKITFALLSILISGTLTGQSITKEKIAGEWICKVVTFTKDETLPDTTSQNAKVIMKMTRDAFTNSSFIFGADGLFSLKFPVNIKNQWTESFSDMNGKTWAINPKTNLIDIGGKENLLAIQIREENGFTSFLLFETPIVLTMEKADR